MNQPVEIDRAKDVLENIRWRIAAISELFLNLQPDGFHMSEIGLSGVGLILDDIREKIDDYELILDEGIRAYQKK